MSIYSNQCALVFLGSFAPFHEAHLDVAVSALNKAREIGAQVGCLIFCLHNDKDVRSKIGDDAWSIERRISHLEYRISAYKSDTPFIINDLTCRKDDVEEMTFEIIKDISNLLKIKPSQIILIMGSDNEANINKYINKNRVICVNRPGYTRVTADHPNLTVAKRKLTKDISSTEIRAKYA